MRGDADVVDTAVDGDVDWEGRVGAVVCGEFGVGEGNRSALCGLLSGRRFGGKEWQGVLLDGVIDGRERRSLRAKPLALLVW